MHISKFMTTNGACLVEPLVNLLNGLRSIWNHHHRWCPTLRAVFWQAGTETGLATFPTHRKLYTGEFFPASTWFFMGGALALSSRSS